MYQAIVTSIHVRPFPDIVKPDGSVEKIERLAIGNCLGNQVIVGKETQDGTLGVFFPSDGVLSETFASNKDLVKRKDETGKPAGGMFEPNRRVRAIKLKGVKSDGFWCPVKMLDWTGCDISSFKEGDLIDTVNGHVVCTKYETPATVRAKKSASTPVARKKNVMFHEHIETQQFRYFASKIPVGSIIHITEKLHGTSGRTAQVRDLVQLSGWRKRLAGCCDWLLRRVGLSVERNPWRYLNGSRRVVLERRTGNSYYGTENFRFNAVKDITLHPGEAIYYELCGYTDTGAPIMGRHDTTGLKDKKIEKRFGKCFEYSYGCSSDGTNGPQTRLTVYRITRVAEDGNEVDLSWYQVVGRSGELGVETVRHIESFMYDGNEEALRAKVERLVNGESGTDAIPSGLDARHPHEGVVIRVEQPDGTVSFYKEKSYIFRVLEGIIKQKDDYIDTEEAEG